MEIKLPELTNDEKNAFAHISLKTFVVYICMNVWFGLIGLVDFGFWQGVLVANYVFFGVLLFILVIYLGVKAFKKTEEIINEKWN